MRYSNVDFNVVYVDPSRGTQATARRRRTP